MSEGEYVYVDLYGRTDRNIYAFGLSLTGLSIVGLAGAIYASSSKDVILATILTIAASLFLVLGVFIIIVIHTSKKRDKALAAYRQLDSAMRQVRSDLMELSTNQVKEAERIRSNFKEVLDNFENNIQLAGKNAEHIAKLIGSAEFLDQTLERASRLVDDQQAVLEQTKRNKEQEMEKMMLRQEAAEARRRVDGWQTTAVSLFSHLERSLSMSKDDAYRLAVEAMLSHLRTEARGNGLEVIDPVPGDTFNADLHQIVEEASGTVYGVNTVVSCISWGYRTGDQVRRRAEVKVARSGGMR